jgi:hypothetical protein
MFHKKLALTSPPSGGRSVSIVHSQTQAMEFNLFSTFTQQITNHVTMVLACKVKETNYIFIICKNKHKKHLLGKLLSKVQSVDTAPQYQSVIIYILTLCRRLIRLSLYSEFPSIIPVTGLENHSLNSRCDWNTLGIKKCIKDHNSIKLFCRGVPVNSKRL